MAITYVDSSTIGWQSGTNISITLPTYSAGDLVVIFINSSHDDMSLPAGGWAWIIQQDTGSGWFGRIAYKIMAGTEGSSVTFTSTDGAGEADKSFTLCLDGVHQSTPWTATKVTHNTATSTTGTFTGITTDDDGAALVAWISHYNSVSYSSWSTPLTEVQDSLNCGLAWGVQATAGASGNKTVTISSSADYEAFLIVFNPAATVPGYGDTISDLGADHHWDFDGDSTDQIGSANGTNTSIVFTSAAIAEDATNCAETNAVGDRVSIPTTTDINNSAQARKAVAGWFAVTAVQRPPKRIYGEGDATTSFAFIIGWGNNVIFEVDSAAFTLQVYSDVFLADDRPYHLCMIFEGNGYGNELRAYLDGVEQLNAQPTDRQPDSATLAARGVAEFGDPAGTVGVGGAEVVLEACVNGQYSHWATWDGADAVMTDAEVREELFEKGALPDVTISSGTESAMQTALDVYADTLRPDAPLCIRIQPNTGDTSFALDLDNITFSPLASIHIQYMGTATLTLTNTNGANCSIVSTPAGGTIVLKTEVTLEVTVKDVVTGANIVGARVYLEAAAGGDLTPGTEIMNATTNGSGVASVTFSYQSDQPIIGRVRKGTSSPVYKTAGVPGPITADGLTETVLLIPDE